MGSARRVKSLKNNKKKIDTNHRDHRSKKGRKNRPFRDRMQVFKHKKEKLHKKESDEQLKGYL